MDSIITTQGAVRKLTAGWRFLPAVDVVEHHQLPIPVDETVDGMFRRGAIFVVDRGDPDRAARVLAHEATHFASRGAMGHSAWSTFMCAIAEGARRGDPALRALRAHVRAVYEHDNLSSLREADEALALLAEVRLNPQTGRFWAKRPMQARIKAAAAHFAREWLHLHVPATGEEAHGVLLHLSDKLRHGWSWCYAGRMPSKPMGANPPPRNLAESAKMLAAASSGVRVGWRNTLFHWAVGIAFAGVLVFVLAEVFQLAIASASILGIPIAAIFLWLYFRQG